MGRRSAGSRPTVPNPPTAALPRRQPWRTVLTSTRPAPAPAVLLTGNTVRTGSTRWRAPAPGEGFRPEIEGLRALAVLLVAGYHIWGSRVSGGVDVFLLLTGFLLTASTTRRLERTGRVRAREFWTGLLRRLLPTTALVVVASIGAALVLLPVTRWEATVPQWFAATLFYENWQLALDSVDYAAARNEASPVQHLWSLSMQGQFYLLLPALAALVLGLHRLTRVRLRLWMGTVLLLVFGGSLVYSVVTTAARQPFAYFDTGARLWEFALGGLLALLLPHLRLPVPVRVLAGWVGIAGLVSVGALLDVTSLFPGWLALWPLGAAALVLVAGTTGSAVAADRLLTSRLARHLGSLSFALYLWHWPVLVYYLVVTGRPAADPLGGLAVLGISLLLAETSHALLERPVARVRTTAAAGPPRPAAARGSFRLTALWLVPAVGAAVVFAHLTQQETQVQPVAVSAERHPGAAVLAGTARSSDPDARPVPHPVLLPRDWVDYRGCDLGGAEVVLSCGPSGGTRSVLLVGDSHAQQLGGLVAEHAGEQDFEVRTALLGACPFSLDPVHLSGRGYDACLAFNRAVLTDVERDRPDLVVVVGSRAAEDSPGEEVPDGYVAAWQAVADLGVPVLVLRDNPRWSENPAECVLREDADACARPRYDTYPDVDPLARAVEDVPGTAYLDTSRLLCDEHTCPPVVGGVYVYMDRNHVSGSYVRTMALAAEPELRRLIGWWR